MEPMWQPSTWVTLPNSQAVRPWALRASPNRSGFVAGLPGALSHPSGRLLAC